VSPLYSRNAIKIAGDGGVIWGVGGWVGWGFNSGVKELISS